MSFPASSSGVLRQVLDRAQLATVGGLLGVTTASYLDVADRPGDPAERDVFASLTSTHRAAMQAEREVMETAAVAHRCAGRLDAAYAALLLSRRRPGRWRALWRRSARPDAEAICARARDYAHAAMAYSEQVERLRALLAA